MTHSAAGALKRTSRIPALPHRDSGANKGCFGKVLVAGGSRGMAGAPCLAARAACRGGAGLVRAAVPESIWDIAAAKLDECLTDGLPQTASGAFSLRALKPLLALAEWADVVVLGPGMSSHPETARLIQKFVPAVKCPLVLDADGLNAFGGGKMAGLARAQPSARILTPHPGEMARLLRRSIPEVQQNRADAAAECARQTRAVTVLKGAGTLVCDGARLFQNTTGNPGMATGGTGDVLAGLIGALLGQGLNAFDAAALGVHLHGLAGDLAAKRLGVWPLIASDLLDELPQAFLKSV